MNRDRDQEILNYIDEGLIVLDQNEKIIHFNEKAKLITGIKLAVDYEHEAGKLIEGDIVIFITNYFAADDGPLTKEALEKINLKIEVESGDVLIGVGIYGDSEIKSLYKRTRKSDIVEKIEFQTEYLGNEIVVFINFLTREMSIKVNGMEFLQKYNMAFGHMVVIDGLNGQIKFFQEKGYTIRGESIDELLRGGLFKSKYKEEKESLDLIGKPLRNYFKSDALFERVSIALNQNIKEKNTSISKGVYMRINERPVYCVVEAIFNLYNADDTSITKGVLIKFRDLSEMKALLNEQSEILESIEKLYETGSDFEDREALDNFENIIGNSPKIREIKYLANRAASVRSNVLITGESGTGKTTLARTIHENSSRRGLFVEVNCASIPQALFESELFGYEKGAFTGASQTGKIGYFERANGGTLFLDEIGELPMEIQVKMLQVLQSKSFFKVGASVPTNVDVRVITATNRDLISAIREGRFRSDLYYRINVFQIHMPALRDRKEDLYLIIKHILLQLASKLGLPSKMISQEAFNLIRHHAWQGNIRELENVLERAMVICPYDIIYPEYIHIQSYASKELKIVLNEKANLKSQMEDYERFLISSVMSKHKNNKEAMCELGLSKSSFYEKLKKYHLDK